MPRFDLIGLDADDTLWHSEDSFAHVEDRFVELVGPFVPAGIDVAAALRATERAPQWTAFARSMGAAVAAVWLVTGAARATISRLVDVIDEPLPGVDVLRFATALNYALLGLAGMGVLGLAVLAVSVVVVGVFPGLLTGVIDQAATLGW